MNNCCCSCICRQCYIKQNKRILILETKDRIELNNQILTDLNRYRKISFSLYDKLKEVEKLCEKINFLTKKDKDRIKRKIELSIYSLKREKHHKFNDELLILRHDLINIYKKENYPKKAKGSIENIIIEIEKAFYIREDFMACYLNYEECSYTESRRCRRLGEYSKSQTNLIECISCLRK